MQVKNKSNEKVRNTWLIVTIIALFLDLTLNVLSFLPLIEYKPTVENVSGFITATLLACLYTYALYHFCYKRKGTFLLTLWCFTTPTGVIALIKEGFHSSVPLFFLGVLAYTAVYIWRFALTLQLRKLNKSLKIHSHFSPDYQEDLNALKSARTLPELDACFHSLICKWPQFEPNSSQEYEKAKEELTTIDV